ncbi:MAG TPA: ACT domain-containing protein [Desulfohalobiaceae bacterium]|nr:ACT domain-containing protein [Desulfohalobiaceae bacterium]
MVQQYILAAVGGDRPGVVAEVTEAIYLCGCNIENSSMTLLGKHFTLMIHLTVDSESVLEELSQRCQSLQKGKALKINIFPIEEGELSPSREEIVKPKYEIRVRGIDRAGIVYRTSQLLASMHINILELSTQVDRSGRRESAPLFTMHIAVEVPKELNGETLRKKLGALAEDLQESISLTRSPY